VSRLHILRVFTNEDGEWGNRLGVFLDGRGIAREDRQRIAAELGFSETVFVEDRAAGRMLIHTPSVELPFAGHPTVGAAWLLAREGQPVTALQLPAGECKVRRDDDLTFVEGEAGWGPRFEYVELGLPAEVRALDANQMSGASRYVWAWIDEAAGTIRARAFLPDEGIPEDEATGSAALTLSVRLGRDLTIHQGHGSVVIARPRADRRGEVGGLVTLDEVRD
jgi:predicted PhzF superfamily epimerase YddE/YHI9